MKTYYATVHTENMKLKSGEPYQDTNLLCGKCKSILYGYDEEICPCCGAFNNFDNCDDAWLAR
jgi:predicted amidophosphoribosyltransferase